MHQFYTVYVDKLSYLILYIVRQCYVEWTTLGYIQSTFVDY